MRVLLFDRTGIFAHRLSAILTGFPAIDVLSASSFEELQPETEMDEVALLVLSSSAAGMQDFAQLYASRPDCPIVVVTTAADETLGLKAVRHGAYEHLLVEELSATLVVRSLQYACERRRSRMALQQSEARFREFFERSREGLFVTTADGTIQEANRAALEMFGYAHEDLVGTSVRQLYAHEGERERLIAHAREHGHYDDFEFEGRRKDGTLISLLATVTVSRDAQGQITRLEGAVKDVTERKLAEQAVRESQRVMNALLNNIPGVVYRVNHDPSWTIQFISERVFDLTGFSVEELKRIGFASIIHEEDRDRVWQETDAAVQQGGQYQVTYRLLTAQGDEKWVSEQGQPVYDDTGQLLAIEGLILDITEQVSAQNALRASEEMFRGLAENIREVFWMSSPSKEILYVSPAYETVWGRPRETLVTDKLSFVEAIHPDDRERVRGALARQSDGTYDEEYRVILPDGSQRWVRDRAFPIRDDDGNVVRIAGIAEDITQQKNSEALLMVEQQHSRRIADRMAAVAATASGVIGARTLEELDAVLRASCKRVLPHDHFTFGEYLPDEDMVRYITSYDASEDSSGERVPLPETPYESVVRGRWSFRSETVVRVPIALGTRVLGVLAVESYTPEVYNEADVEVLEAFAAVAAGAMQNIELLREVRVSEERFRLVSMAANDIMWEYRWQEDSLWFSEKYFDLFGLDRADYAGLIAEWCERIRPCERERVLSEWMAAAADPNCRTWWGEYHLRREDGSYVHVADRCYFVRNPDGSPARAVGAFVDITEQKRAERELRDSEERFRQIAENIREVYYVAEGDFSRFTYVSPAYDKVFGGSPADLYVDANEFIARVHEEDRARLAAGMAGVAQGAAQEMEYRVLDPSGHVRWIHSRGFPVFDEDGRVYRIVGTSEDITDRKLAEQEVRASSEELKAILELSALPIAVLNEDLNVELWNKSAERVFGWSAEEVIGRQYPLCDESGALPRVNLLTALGGTALEGREIVRRTRDGALIDLRIWSTVLPESSDGKRRVVGIFEPVTEQKQLESQLRHAQKMEAVGQLAGGIAHDFNNILTAINGQAELIIDQLPTGHPLRSDVIDILRAGERAADLTRQLLAFSRKQIIKMQPIEISELVGGMVKLLQRMIGPDIALTMNPAAQPAWIEADRGQIEQVIMNLSVNARDAMPEGGELCITVENGSSDRRIKRSGWRKDQGVRIIVRDTGFGMNYETRSRIFEPFFTTKDPGKGTGLGLATVYGIVTHAGGEISVESIPGEGTTFVIELPTIEQPSVLPAAQHETKAPTAGSETILVVDDEATVRAVAVRSLQRQGYIVLEAANADDALKLAHEHPGNIDVLLTDMVMPKRGGRELADQVIRGRPQTKIIFMSGYTEDEALRRGVLARDEAFVEKPFSPSILVRRVREALDRNLR